MSDGRKGIFTMANIIIILLFVIFIILDVITLGFLHSLIIKFFKSLPLFIRDIHRRDRGVFRGYGFWSFCGLGGSGKTLSIVNYLFKNTRKISKRKSIYQF